MRLQVVLPCSLALAFVSASVRADVPPPEGVKRVPYSFTVEGLARAPGFALFAYPVSQSNGAPTAELAVISDKAVRLGRSSLEPTIYAMPAADFEEWSKSHHPTNEGLRDPAVEALIRGDKAVACEGRPSPKHELPSDDARDRISEVLRVVEVSATKCRLESSSDTTTTSANVGSATTASAPAAPDGSATNPASGGCASCAIGSARDASAPRTLVAMAIGLLLLGMRRPRHS